MNAQSNEERLARLETTIEHLATKADLIALETRMQQFVFRLIGFSIAIMTAVIALATATQIIVK